MGWKAKALALLLGLAFLGVGAWPLGLVCLLYLALALRPRRSSRKAQPAVKRQLPPRLLLSAFLFVLSALALAAGGVLSPFVFLGAGITTALWPVIIRATPLPAFVPVSDSILLRSKYFPYCWCSVAELRPGAGPFPMAASSFSGTLMAFTDTGRTYFTAKCRALGRRGAEEKLLAELRAAAPAGRAGAYLLPLDATAAADLLTLKLAPTKLGEEIGKCVPALSGLLVLECSGPSVTKAAAYTVRGRGSTAALPGGLRQLTPTPLTWEVFDAIGKRTRWPDPDPYSGLLDSMLATRGVPFAERMSQLESSGDLLTVRSLGGEDVKTTRPQLRAILSIYS